MENFISKLKSISAKSHNSEPRRPGVAPERPQSKARSRQSLRRSGERLLLRFKQLAAVISERDADSSTSLPPKKPLYRRPLVWAAVLITGGGGALIWGIWSIERSLPDVADISSFVRDGTLTIKAADGSVLQQLGPATREKLAFQQIPPQVVRAFVAAEDRRFYQHTGVDYQSIIRAITTNLLARDVVEGGSTITQQVARIIYLNQERSIGRKVQEALLAQKIERKMSKQQVLEKYLNLVYLGSGAYGVADAAWVYFSKPVNKLTLPEIATIAGLPPAPSEYSPLVNLKAAQERRDIVLARMQEAGFITAAEAEKARSEKLALKPSIPKKLYSDTPYFTSYVQQQLSKLVSKEQLEVGGLTVETTLNVKWQKTAENVIKNAVKNIGPYEGFSQASLVAIDPRNGEIRAMVGGTDFGSSQFNRVTQAQRQPGSSFKPILYTTAIATGISPHDGYLDAPFTVDGYQPQNYGKKYSGWMSLRDALTNSVNVISVKLIIDVGFDPVLKVAKLMGIKSKLMPTYSLSLGASEVNLLELANAYATLADKGRYTEAHGIRRVLNRKGEVIYDAKFTAKQVIDKGTVAIMTWMMQNVVNSGTGQAAQIGRPVAGKTGTSEEARDLWFIGFIPQMVAGVWLGNDDNAPTWSYSSTAASLWHDFMSVVVKGMAAEKFPELPTNIDTRKGSIKAKPITPGSAYNGSLPSSSGSDSSSSGSSDSYQGDYSEPARDPAPADNYAPEPQPESAPQAEPEPAPQAEPDPAPPAPEDSAEPAPASDEPAPPVTSGPPPDSDRP